MPFMWPEELQSLLPKPAKVILKKQQAKFQREWDIVAKSFPDMLHEESKNGEIVAARRYSLQKHNKARPKKSSAETDDEYQRKVEVWQAQQPLDVELQVKGNSMTQAYYTRHILPHHINRIKQLQQRYQRTVFLQEDNDPSHGNRSYNNVAARLNPIESIWQVVSQRLRGSSWSTGKEFKEAIQAEWRKVTLSEL